MHFGDLINTIQTTHERTQKQAIQQVNNALTIRNWLIGCYIVEYEQNGEDKAEYGAELTKLLAAELLKLGIQGLKERSLRNCRTFYQCYPQIWQTVSAILQLIDNKNNIIWQTLSAKFDKTSLENENRISQTLSDESLGVEKEGVEIWQTLSAKSSPHPDSLNPEILLSRLNFSHFIELIKAETFLKRTFYEVQTIKNNWSVRELKRAMETLLFERTGASGDKESVIAKIKDNTPVLPADIIKSPYILEFLGLEEKAEYSENDLEQGIINHLQKFMVEMGRGFCFEARQKRITFDNKHYYIDLVFYHRILKCHVVVDLKLGEFGHEDAGQMNLYLNYFKENEMTEGDNAPVGIILCAQKNDALVKYATGGLPMEVFVSKYMLQLPSVEELQKLIEADTKKFNKEHSLA